MAKVPTYKRQTAPVKSAGQTMLNAFANPQNVSSGIRAAQNTLNQVTDIGMKFFEYELKQSRATAQAEKDAEFEKWILQTQDNIVSGKLSTTTKRTIVQDPELRISRPKTIVTQDNPLTALKKIQKSSKAEIRRLASSISDPVARRRFITSANKRLTDVSPGINKALRVRYNDHAISVADITLSNLIKRSVAETEPQRVKTKIEITNHNLALAEQGSITQVQAVSRTLKSLSDVDSGAVEQKTFEALNSKEPEIALANLIKEVADKNNYTDLLPRARARLSTSLVQKRDSYERAAEGQIRRNLADTKKAEKEKAKKIKSKVYGQITDYWKSIGKGQEIERPYTSDQLRDMETEGKLPYGAAKTLIEFSENEGKEQNIAKVSDYKRQIADAITDQELENIRTEIEQSEEDNEISPRSLNKLDSLITRMQNQDKTPEGQNDKKYLSRIKSVFSGRDRFMVKDTSRDILMSDADGQEMYNDLRESGMRPYEAYVETITEGLAKDEKFMQKVLGSVPSEFRQKFMRTSGRMLGAKRWKESMVSDMETKWENSLKNRDRTGLKLGLDQVSGMTRKDRLSVRSLYRTEVAIRAIREYIENRPKKTPEKEK